jgi:hypothetical protein
MRKSFNIGDAFVYMILVTNGFNLATTWLIHVSVVLHFEDPFLKNSFLSCIYSWSTWAYCEKGFSIDPITLVGDQ